MLAFGSGAPVDTSSDENEPGLVSKPYLPVIDLGYSKIRASKYDKDGDFFVFSNIRYAAPPTGKRRFQLPQPPLDEEEINDGNTGFMCMQATNIQWKWLDVIPNPTKQSEDCLFLDVVVPGCVMREFAQKSNSAALSNTSISTEARWYNSSAARDEELPDGLPVMVWIHGGGFAFGEKGGIYNPKGLMKAAKGRMIYVAFNYRLGAFGFLPGEQVKKHGATNAGLHDQRLALDWVHQHIYEFGGDPSSITVLGESAGASSIMHHLTSPEPLQFHRAIMQSTAFYPQYDKDILETQYSRFVSLADCDCEDSFKCLVNQDSSILSKANKDAVFASRYGTFEFGPYVDRTYVPLLPLFRLGYGHYHRGVKILSSYNSDEGFLFADPSKIKTNQFNKLLPKHFPNATEETLKEIKTLYPASKYKTVFRRIASVISEWIVSCNSVYLEEHFPGTYLYKFSIEPGIHSQDLFLTFWGSLPALDDSAKAVLQTDDKVDIGDIARSLQSYLVSFTVSGNPNMFRRTGGAAPTIHFPKTTAWKGRPMVEITKQGFSYLTLDSDGPNLNHCKFWMEGDWTGR
ncbi:Carboxylesterase [Lipomyces arxii]|uniref:Carboxylesterase n=1 Tax=Lipomyces arxii TaxID=56418 RepID=UPI0034CF9990